MVLVIESTTADAHNHSSVYVGIVAYYSKFSVRVGEFALVLIIYAPFLVPSGRGIGKHHFPQFVRVKVLSLAEIQVPRFYWVYSDYIIGLDRTVFFKAREFTSSLEAY